jgi:hypothetical protein
MFEPVDWEFATAETINNLNRPIQVESVNPPALLDS